MFAEPSSIFDMPRSFIFIKVVASAEINKVDTINDVEDIYKLRIIRNFKRVHICLWLMNVYWCIPVAHLEQYVNCPNRVEVVVEELLGIGRVELAEEFDEPLLPLPDPEPAYVGKGKGKGKGKSNRTRPPVVQPQEQSLN